jgi:hypothetical protein
VGLNQIDTRLPPSCGEPQRTAPVKARVATDHLDRKPFLAKSLRARPEFVKTQENEAVTILQPPGEVAREDLCSADIQRVDELTDDRTAITH